MFSATHQVRLTNAPFSAMAKVGDSQDSEALNVKYSPVAAKFWVRARPTRRASHVRGPQSKPP